AVLPRTLAASSNAPAWLARFGPVALIAARSADAQTTARCSGEGPGCSSTWWSATPSGVRGGLTGAWSIVLETHDYFVAELEPGSENAATPVAGGPAVEGPSPWEDVPADVTITLDAKVACHISAVAVIAHLPHERRDVLEIDVDDRVARVAAHHGVPIYVGTDETIARSSIVVRVRSLVGSPVSLADVRVLGDGATCAPGWPAVLAPQTPQMEIAPGRMLDLAAEMPRSGHPLVALASAALADRGDDADLPLLRESTARPPEL